MVTLVFLALLAAENHGVSQDLYIYVRGALNPRACWEGCKGGDQALRQDLASAPALYSKSREIGPVPLAPPFSALPHPPPALQVSGDRECGLETMLG